MITIPGADDCTIAVQIVSVTDKGYIVDFLNELAAKSRAIYIEIGFDLTTTVKDKMSNIPIRRLFNIADLRLLEVNAPLQRYLLKIGQKFVIIDMVTKGIHSGNLALRVLEIHGPGVAVVGRA